MTGCQEAGGRRAGCKRAVGGEGGMQGAGEKDARRKRQGGIYRGEELQQG